jgi:hypothetical protein
MAPWPRPRLEARLDPEGVPGDVVIENNFSAET